MYFTRAIYSQFHWTFSFANLLLEDWEFGELIGADDSFRSMVELTSRLNPPLGAAGYCPDPASSWSTAVSLCSSAQYPRRTFTVPDTNLSAQTLWLSVSVEHNTKSLRGWKVLPDTALGHPSDSFSCRFPLSPRQDFPVLQYSRKDPASGPLLLVSLSQGPEHSSSRWRRGLFL